MDVHATALWRVVVDDYKCATHQQDLAASPRDAPLRGGEVLLLTECALMYSKVMHCLHALPVSEKRSKSIFASCSQPVPGGSR